MQPDDETPEPVEAVEPEAPSNGTPEHVPADPRVELPVGELRALIEQSARESAERVHASYQRNPKIQRGLRLLERYEKVREDLAMRQVEKDAEEDHREQVRERERQKFLHITEQIERNRRIRLGGKP